MGETQTAGLQTVWQKIADTVTENLDSFWTVAAAAVAAIAVIWFCKLGLRLIKNMTNSAAR